MLNPRYHRAAKLLLAARKSCRWSQRTMASYLGCAPSMIATMETGKKAPGRVLANRIEALFDIPASVWDRPADLRARQPRTAAGEATR